MYKNIKILTLACALCLVAGALLGHFLPVGGSNGAVSSVRTLTEDQLDDAIGSSTIDGERIPITAREVIKSMSTLDEYASADGTYITYYADEKTVKEQGEYKDGLKEGLWKTFFNNGNVATKKSYVKGNPTGTSYTFYEDGKKRSVENIENGIVSFWYQNGKKQSEGRMKDNLRDSVWTFWNEDGAVTSSGLYRKGLKEGLHKEFFPDGRKESEINYSAGKKNGHAVWFRTDTTAADKKTIVKHFEGDFVNDVQTGHWIYYQITGKKGNEGDYADNKMTGLWKWYFEDESIWRTAVYKNGEKTVLTLSTTKMERFSTVATLLTTRRRVSGSVFTKTARRR